MLAASLAADVPLFIASPTSDCASAGASFVPSPVIATRWPSACSLRMKPILSSGLASAMKSSTPASLAIVAAVRGLSPVIITVRMPIRRNSAKRSTRPSLTVSLSSMSAEHAGRRRRMRERRRAEVGDPVGGGARPPRAADRRALLDGVDRALEDDRARRRSGRRSCGSRRGTAISSAIVGREAREAGVVAGRRPAGRASPRRSRASSTIERPSGVSSRIEATSAAVRRLGLGRRRAPR